METINKLRTLLTKGDIKDDINMNRTNYVPVFLEAETEGPIVSKKNPRGYTCRYRCLGIDDEDASLILTILDKHGNKVADGYVEYDTRDGWMRNSTYFQLADDEYGRANSWLKEQRYCRAFAKSLLHRFGEVNESNFLAAAARPKPVRARVSPEKKNKIVHTMDTTQVKGHYVNYFNPETGERNTFYRRPHIRHFR